ncbi:nuclear cap-binding protein subunit 1-like isoform X2 [Xenia sp. Carnegie-2017]|uniref:nuclear cap-binding protein subunit 1-like isoform X2 n=1 Tax=Xenia sp. Carnegie-2017 TaxID=2897299 RepID=UPI001F046947|nr:nuclear cap-binding protein subunit 1-like isoform X2 [Xenia sp. Carnegie-2017]
MSYKRRHHYDRERDDGSRNRKMRKVDMNDFEDKLESLITKVGEKSSAPVESNLQQLANVLEADLPSHKEKILKIICTCVSNFPDKIGVYSSLVGLLNVKNYKCGEDFLDMLIEDLKMMFKCGSLERVQMTIRFLADLVNTKVILPSSLMNLFENFIAVTMEEDVLQVRSDWFVHTVLLSLPWVGKELWNTKRSDCEQLFAVIEAYLNKRRKIHVPGLRVWSSDEPHMQEEYLDCLWAQIQKLKKDNWMERHIRRPYIALSETLTEALQHTLPQIPIMPREQNVEYPVPQVVFRMFDYTDVPEGPIMPGAHAIERHLVEESLNRIIASHYKNRKECASQLMKFSERDKIPLEYCIIEVIFGNLFRLPVSSKLELFYGSLFVELCKTNQSSFPGVLAQATELLFERIDTMNITCRHRFVNWLSYHFSQFQYKWNWDDRISLTNESPNHPQRSFIVDVLSKCLRSSYHDFILEVIPDPLHVLVPSKPFFTYNYSDDSGSSSGHEHAKRLVDSIKEKKSIDELLSVLERIPDTPADGDAIEDDECSTPSLKIDVCVQVLLRAGAKSVSHTFKALDKFNKLLRSVLNNDEDERHCLVVLNSFWCFHTQMIQIITEKLMRMSIIRSKSLINWIFSKEMSGDFQRLFVWEILHSVLRKITRHAKKDERRIEAREK